MALVQSVLDIVKDLLRPPPPAVSVPAPAPPPPAAPRERDFDPETLPWIDRPGADIDAYVRGLPEPAGADLASQLRHFRHRGFAVFPGAISHELIDAFLADLDELVARRTEFSTMITHEIRGNVPIRALSEEDLAYPRYRFCNVHDHSLAGKLLALNPTVLSFLGHVFQDRAVAMQSLTFTRSSEQTTHQDFPYVVSRIPSHLAACWIALEDVHPDAGPLSYYPGSHRISPKFDFGDGMLLTPESSRDELDFARFLEEQCELRGIQEETFTPRKGDVFIWHAALAHRGSAVKDRALTRKSYVVHYSSLRAYPEDRRAAGPPIVHEMNGGLVYGNPLAPREEDVLRHGEPFLPQRAGTPAG